MEIFQRSLVNNLVKRLNERPTFMLFVVGPRHSGKTTIVHQALQNIDRPSNYVDVANDTRLQRNRAWYSESTSQTAAQSDLTWLGETWRNARARASAHPNGSILVLDEIQEIPDWSWVVKGLWDSDRCANRQLHVVLVCSAPIRIQSNLTESMAGRFEPLYVPHWSFSEMQSAFGFDLNEYLYFGGYPGAAKFIRDTDRWRNYVVDANMSTIEKDILAMTSVDKPGLLKELLALGIRYSGEILPLAKVLKLLPQVQDTTTLESYFDLLAEVKLLTSFRQFEIDPMRRWHREKLPKLGVSNNASLTASSTYTFKQARAEGEFWGKVVVSAVGAHILNSATGRVKPYYWRERTRLSKLNRWFVLHRGPNNLGIRVERGRERIQEKDLTAFNQSVKPNHTIFVGEGGIPLSEFMLTPVDRWIDG